MNYDNLPQRIIEEQPASAPGSQDTTPQSLTITELPKKKHHKKLLAMTILVVLVVVGAGILWFATRDAHKQASSTTKGGGAVKLSMDYVKPTGWKETIVSSTARETITSFTAPGTLIRPNGVIQSGAEIRLITQITNDYKLDALPEINGYKVEGDKKEIELHSALYALQYLTAHNKTPIITTTFLLNIRYDVFMEKKIYDQPEYNKVYQALLDSFVPNGAYGTGI